jgi:predicted acyltransferase
MNQRLISLDAFRGFTIAGMLIVNNPGDWNNLYPLLAHAKWHGWTFTDWIFPFFLFIVGMSMAFSLQAKGISPTANLLNNNLGQGKTSKNNQGTSSLSSLRSNALISLARRALTIFAIGLFLNWIPNFDLNTIRIPGVLQRIALCTILAAPLVIYCSTKTLAVSSLALLCIYSFLMLYVAVPDANGIVNTGLLEAGRDTGAFVDRWLLSGHLWASAKTWDPEGVLSSLPAIASLLLGSIAGRYLLSAKDGAEKTVWMLLVGLLALWIGVILDSVLMPINKPLWTPSYAIFMTGWALIVFAAFYWLMDASKDAKLKELSQRWFKPLTIMGMNALFLFALSGLVAKALNFIKFGQVGQQINLKQVLYSPLKAIGFSPVNSSLLFAILFLLSFYAIAWTMWKRKWFVKV